MCSSPPSLLATMKDLSGNPVTDCEYILERVVPDPFLDKRGVFSGTPLDLGSVLLQIVLYSVEFACCCRAKPTIFIDIHQFLFGIGEP